MKACPIPLTEDLIPRGRRNRPGVEIKPTYITIHDTGNDTRGAGAMAHARYLKGIAADVPVSWHFTVDDGGAYQHLPLHEMGYHAGPGNGVSIGIEICEDAGGDRAKAEDNAAKLVAWLLDELGLDISVVVPHQHWQMKYCPHILLPRWDKWIEQVKSYMAPKPAWDPQAEIDKLMQKGIINTRHEPHAPVTWGQLATVLNRVLESSH